MTCGIPCNKTWINNWLHPRNLTKPIQELPCFEPGSCRGFQPIDFWVLTSNPSPSPPFLGLRSPHPRSRLQLEKTMLKHLRVRIIVDTKIDSNLIPVDSIIRFQCESYKCSKREAFRNENNASWTWGTGPSRLKGKSAHSGDKKHHIFIDHATPISTSYRDIFDHWPLLGSKVSLKLSASQQFAIPKWSCCSFHIPRNTLIYIIGLCRLFTFTHREFLNPLSASFMRYQYLPWMHGCFHQPSMGPNGSWDSCTMRYASDISHGTLR